jgi:hypothetical protein
VGAGLLVLQTLMEESISQLAVKGAQTRSCSMSVLMEEAAEQIASVYNALVILAKDGQLGRRVWQLQQQRPVGTVAVVMLDVDPKDLLEQGVQATLRLVADPELDGVSGRYFSGTRLAQPHPQAHDIQARRRLGELSDRLCGLTPAPASPAAASGPATPPRPWPGERRGAAFENSTLGNDIDGRGSTSNPWKGCGPSAIKPAPPRRAIAVGRRLHPLVDHRTGAAARARAVHRTLKLLLGELLVFGPGRLDLTQQLVIGPTPAQIVARQRPGSSLHFTRIGTRRRPGPLLVKAEPLVKRSQLQEDPPHLGPCHPRPVPLSRRYRPTACSSSAASLRQELGRKKNRAASTKCHGISSQDRCSCLSRRATRRLRRFDPMSTNWS